MIKSMTGYGRARQELHKRDITVEVRSVNNRYLDCTVKMPRMYAFAEDAVKKHVQQAVSRGKVDVFITVDATAADVVKVAVNRELAAQYAAALGELSDVCGTADYRPAPETLARFPDVLTVTKADEDLETVSADLCAVLGEALAAYNDMRAVEGQKLAEDISNRLDAIERYTGQVEMRSPETVAEYRAKLTARMEEVLQSTTVDEQRILMEAAIYADKVAVDEETVRLRSHVAQLRTMLASDEPMGRKMDFLIQEVNRESNTIGSKCNDVETARMVVDIKAEIEKMDGVCEARDKYYEILVEIQKNEPTRKEGDYKRKQNVRHVIKDYSLKSVDEFREFYESLISVDRLVEEMRAQRVQGRKNELELFVSALQSEIQWHCEQLLQHYTGEIEAVAQDYSAAFNESVKAPFEKCKMDMGFDATWCIYSAFLNFFSRWDDFIDGIDAPIFFKKSASFIGASVASGVGFSLMGLLFPPLGVSIGAALLAAITATRFAGVSWETSAAKKIVKAFEKADVVSKYNSVISEYWSKIATAFDVSAKKVDADWEQYLQNLSTLIQSCDQSSIREQSEELRSLLVFLGQCPQKLSPQLSI